MCNQKGLCLPLYSTVFTLWSYFKLPLQPLLAWFWYKPLPVFQGKTLTTIALILTNFHQGMPLPLKRGVSFQIYSVYCIYCVIAVWITFKAVMLDACFSLQILSKQTSTIISVHKHILFIISCHIYWCCDPPVEVLLPSGPAEYFVCVNHFRKVWLKRPHLDLKVTTVPDVCVRACTFELGVDSIICIESTLVWICSMIWISGQKRKYDLITVLSDSAVALYHK